MMPNRINTLIVEDSADYADTLEMALATRKEADFVVTKVATLAGAKAVLARQEMDVVILDLHLPDAAGIDLVKAVKEASSNPVIVLTGWGDVDTDAAKAAGADEVLMKPIDPAVLCRKLHYSVVYHRNIQIRDLVEASMSQLGQAIKNLAATVTESGHDRKDGAS